MGRKKTWEELEIKDDYLFAKVMQNADICKELLELMLDIKIEKIKYIEVQKPCECLRKECTS
jgi:hypothetical protein